MPKTELLNYKYEIFPTRPQRAHLDQILRQARIQWNKAVIVRKKLKASLISGQIEFVLNACLSLHKKEWQAERKKAILNFQNSRPEFASLPNEDVAKLYDLSNITGEALPIELKHLDLKLLTEELKEKYDRELSEWKEAKARGVEYKNLPKRPLFWQMMNAINNHAGFAAKNFMDKSFKSPKNKALSNIRANISGYKNSIRWNQAVSPKKGQRQYGARGEPQFKKRGEGGFTFPIPQIYQKDFAKLVRGKRRKSGHQIYINPLPDGMRWMDFAYHRSIPEASKIKQITINKKAGRYFAVLSLEVPDSVWKIKPMQEGWMAGIDPGAATALTIALKNSKTGELRHLAVHYEILEKGLEKLEKMQQELARKQGPRRKRTAKEIEEELKQFKNKKFLTRLTTEEQEKKIANKKQKLEKTMLKQQASKRWQRCSRRVSALQMRFANQRADVLHKISRALAEGCELVAIGNWEPEKEVSYRKKLRALKKKVKQGIAGAAQELEQLKNEKSKQGPKGAKKKRRSARDRSIATLRRLVNEKAERASIKAFTEINEAGSTQTCCICGETTGPKQDLSIRQWRCRQCNTNHNRDLNSAFNILKKAEIELGAAQAPNQEKLFLILVPPE
jgi:transposase